MAGAPVVEVGPDAVEEVDSVNIDFAMFKRLGASIRLGSETEREASPGNASLLAVSNIYGAVFIGDGRGLYAARTATLLELAEAAKSSGEAKVAEGEDGVRLVPDLEGIHTLSLSADELLLAVGAKGGVCIFSTQDLIDKVQPPPRLQFDFSVRSLAWSPSDNRTLLAVLDDDTLRIGDLSKGMQGPSRSDVVAASWSPDGRHVAFASKDGAISIATKDLATVVATIKPALSVGQAELAHHVLIDTLRWIRPGIILLSLVPFNEDGSEVEDSPLVALETASRSSFADEASDVREVLFDGLSPSIQSEATDANAGPYLHASLIKEWNVVIVANRKSYDDHINLVGWREEDGQETLRQWQIEDDTFIPRVDMPESGDDNFVVGLAIDRTSTQIQLYDPRDRETQLPPQPIMLHVTSEGTLSAFVFARLDGAKDVPNLVTAPRPTFAPLEELQAAPQEPTPQKEAEEPKPSEAAPSPEEREGTASRGGAEEAKPVDDVSRLRAAVAEAAERRAAEARAAQGQALPPADEDADLLEDEEGATPLQRQPVSPPLVSKRPPASEDKAVITPLEEPDSANPTTQKPGLFAAPPPIPAFLPGSEGKQAIRTLAKPDSVKPEMQKPGLFAAAPPVPAFLPGSEGKQAIKPLAKPDGAEKSTQKPGLFAAAPPIPDFLPGSEGNQVIKTLDKPVSAKPQTSKPGLFAAAPPIPTFLPGSEGKQVIKALEKPVSAKPETPRPGLFAAAPPIPAFLPGSEGKQVIKPIDKTAPSVATSPFGATQPKPSTPSQAPPLFGAPSTAPLPTPPPFTGPSTSPFGAFSSSGNTFAAPSPPLGGSSPAFGGFAPTPPFGFSAADAGEESGRTTPAFGARTSAPPPAASSPFAVPKFGEPAKPEGDKAVKMGTPNGGFAGVGTGGGFSGFRTGGGFSPFAAPPKSADAGPVPEAPAAALLETRAAHKEPAPLQGLGKRESVQERRESVQERRPSSPKRGHSSTDLQAEEEASMPAANQGHVKRTAVRASSRGQGAAGKATPQEGKKPAGGVDEEAEFLNELDEVQHMAAELDALLAPLRASSPAGSNNPLHRESLEGLFRSTAALYQECLELREEVAGAGRRVQGLMADTHRADTWRIVLESKVEQARDERFRVLWDEKGLEPKVEAQRKGLLATDQALKRKLTDLQIHLQTLELRQRPPVKESPARRLGAFGAKRPGKEGAFPPKEQPKPSVQSLYNTVNTQMAVAQEQASRLTHLMAQLGINDRATPPKSGMESTPRAEEILRSLNISPTERSPAVRTPKSSAMRTGTGTVFRVPDFDDVIGDVSPSKSPLPKQRLTYSPASANGGVRRAGTATPQSAGKAGTPIFGEGTPLSERRVAREGLSKYHAPTTTIKRGGTSQRAQPPPSPVPYAGAHLSRRTSGAPQLVEEASEESVYTEEDEIEAVSEGEQRQAERRLSRRSPQAFGVSGPVSGGLTPGKAQPPPTQAKPSGGPVARANEPPKTKPPGFGQNPFQSPFANFGQKSAEGVKQVSSTAFAPFGTGPGSKEGTSASTSGPFSGFALPVRPTSMTGKSDSGFKPATNPFSTGPTSDFAGFGAPSSSKAAPATVSELKFDTSESTLTSAASVPAASSQPGLFSGFAGVTSQPAGSKREAGSRPGVKLNSAVSAPPQAGGFSSFAELAKTASDVGRSRKRDGDKRRGDRGISDEVTISDDEAPSEEEGRDNERRKRGDEKRRSEETQMSNEERISVEKKVSDRTEAPPVDTSAPKTGKQHVAQPEAATSEAPETSKAPAVGFASFGAASGFAGFSQSFNFGAGKQGASEGAKPPNLFGAVSAAPPVSFAGFAKPQTATTGETPSPFGVSAAPFLKPLAFKLDSKSGEEKQIPSAEEQEPSSSLDQSKEQQAGTPDRATGQSANEDEQKPEGPKAAENAPVDTKLPEQVSSPAPAQKPVSAPDGPPPPEAPENPESPRTPPTEVPSSPFGTTPPQSQSPGALFSSTAFPAFTPSSPVAASASPFSSPPSVKTPSPFAFAQIQPAMQSFAPPPPAPPIPPPQEEKEESMDEEDVSNAAGALGGFGGFGGFGLGSATPADPSKPSPFGLTSFPSPGAPSPAISAPPSDPNALFKPASFALPGASSPFTASANPSGFGKITSPFGAPTAGSAFGQPASPGFGGSGFGQPASSGFGSPGQIGGATSSNQVIGGMVGGFGQSRTLGPALPGVAQSAPAFGSAPTAGAFGSFAAKLSGGFGGFAGQSSGGGFAAAASSPGSGFGGFGGAASPGFSGFAGAAAQGGGFGGLGGAPSFGGPPAGGDPRFTQIRK
ncbi:nuclear pore complex protein Nup214 [Klebsormidium nitens]|uniref:Nuclear pore complex protein Nup214 n=1 Tax=Klebsormidium nitens TaxID=105231 RepID=A0A1Y1HVE8_KLENI|nr:nuclear pore complex protein Nup214 [Klebsormidium nitens]|eukprot:GAQ82604.1 nuclear pore complex protein Nup214 [Klebsormidium nitens]